MLTHGNGPCGLDLRRAEIAHEREGLPLTPLANCVADTQIIRLLRAVSKSGHRRHQVEVDKTIRALATRPKPIGAFFSEAQRDELQQAHPDWHFVEDSGRGYRRVVASPQPLRIVEADAIKTLTQKAFVVIGAGGGGIPVVRTEQGDYQSVDAVIDKDLHRAAGARDPRRRTGDHHRGRKSVHPLWQAESAGAGHGERGADDALQRRGPFPGGQHAAQNRRLAGILRHGGKRVIITSPDCSARRAARGNRYPYY